MRLRILTLAAAIVAVLAPAARADVSTHYAAPRPTSRPILVLIHGGGWEAYTSEQTAPLAQRLHQMGYPVINAAYRLACYGSDGVGLPGCPHVDKLVLDVSRQVRWGRRHHAELGTTSRQVVLVGLSAGGHLAALLTARGIADAAIGFSAPTSLPNVIPYLVENVNGLMGCAYADCPGAWLAASATSYNTKRPMFLAYGQHEAEVPAVAGDAMHRVDPNAKVVRIPGTPHCCTDNWEYPILPAALTYVRAKLTPLTRGTKDIAGARSRP
jgi:acetyl esterase/lipase